MDISLLFQKGENSPSLQGSMEGGVVTCIQAEIGNVIKS